MRAFCVVSSARRADDAAFEANAKCTPVRARSSGGAPTLPAQPDIALATGVNKGTISKWLRDWEQAGLDPHP